jgi:hypothetical protein
MSFWKKKQRGRPADPSGGRHVALRREGMGVSFFLHQTPGQPHRWSWTYDNPMLERDMTNVVQINRAMFFMEEGMGLAHSQGGVGYGDGTVPDLPGWPWDLFREGPLKPTTERRLHDAIDAIARVPLDPEFPVERLRYIHETVVAGEVEIALEDLASNIDDFDIPVPDSVRSELLDVAVSMGLDQRYVDLLARPR